MEEGYELEWEEAFRVMHHTTPTLEERLSKYKHRMELLRTIIGTVVLGIQLIILYQLVTH
jgi:hypothetical protein